MWAKACPTACPRTSVRAMRPKAVQADATGRGDIAVPEVWRRETIAFYRRGRGSDITKHDNI
jgi:hypothetical protein